MYDVVVVGGGIAGLSAALTLGRAQCRVLVLNGGERRNRPAEHAHGFVSRDGIPPLELLRVSREELRAHPSVEIREIEATDASATSHGFSLTMSNGETIEARKIVLATGVVDELPEIAGAAELWGKGVHHCPYCDGWEVRDRSWASLGDSSLTFERVALLRGWASELNVLTNGSERLSAIYKERFTKMEVRVDERRVASLRRTNEGDVAVRFEMAAA